MFRKNTEEEEESEEEEEGIGGSETDDAVRRREEKKKHSKETLMGQNQSITVVEFLFRCRVAPSGVHLLFPASGV